jgi:hypothetical protein
MKNTEYSQLYREYRSLVENFNTIVDRIIKTKFEMDYLWKYKKDYPADWKRMAEKLASDRYDSKSIRFAIREIKLKMREVNSNFTKK